MPRPLALFTLSLLAITPLSAQSVGEYPVSLPQSSPALRQQRPSVAFSGRNYLVAWEEGDAVYANLLDIQGRPVGGLGTRISGSESAANPHVAFVLDSYLVVWLSVPAGAESHVYVSRVAPDTGEVVDTTRISIYGAESPYALDLKSDGTSAFLVLAAGGRLTGARLDRNAQVLDTVSVTPTMIAGSPAVAWNGSEWLVAFEEVIYSGALLPLFSSNIRAVRLSPSLTVLDPQPLPIALELTDLAPVVAASPDQFFIAWTRIDLNNGDATTGGRYVPNVGEPGLDVTLGGAGSAESVVWDGGQFALGVAVETSPSNFDLWATHVELNGDVRDRFFIGRTTGDSPDFALFTTSGPVLAAYPRISFEPAYGGVTRIFIREPTAVIRGRATRH